MQEDECMMNKHWQRSKLTCIKQLHMTKAKTAQLQASWVLVEYLQAMSLRQSVTWVMRCCMMLWKAKTWPQGVIWGHRGSVSKEMGHCTSPPVIMTTCTRHVADMWFVTAAKGWHSKRWHVYNARGACLLLSRQAALSLRYFPWLLLHMLDYRNLKAASPSLCGLNNWMTRVNIDCAAGHGLPSHLYKRLEQLWRSVLVMLMCL